jgi:hypothetical protein
MASNPGHLGRTIVAANRGPPDAVTNGTASNARPLASAVTAHFQVYGPRHRQNVEDVSTGSRAFTRCQFWLRLA